MNVFRRIKIKWQVFRGRALDIWSRAPYPSNVLSNLCSNGFKFDGVLCGSMEGFLQSLKQNDINKQRQICSMKGANARKKSVTSWQTEQTIWWKGRAINRQSPEYTLLVRDAYQAMFDKNERFRTALMQTRGLKLVHTRGEENSFKTILTSTEFCGILEDLRREYDERLTEDLQPAVMEMGIGSEDGARGRLFGISPIVLIDKKLVIRTDVGLWYMADVQKNIEKHSIGLMLERVTELNDSEFEVVLSPLQLEDANANYVLATDFSGEFEVGFLTEDLMGNRRFIGSYDYIDK